MKLDVTAEGQGRAWASLAPTGGETDLGFDVGRKDPTPRGGRGDGECRVKLGARRGGSIRLFRVTRPSFGAEGLIHGGRVLGTGSGSEMGTVLGMGRHRTGEAQFPRWENLEMS